MKNLLLMSKTLLVAFVGAIVFSVFGLSPFAGAAASVTGSMLMSPDKSSAFTGINLTDLAAQLGAYSLQVEKKVWAKVQQGITLENYLDKVPNVTDEYAVTNASFSEVLQPWQSGFQPKGTASFNARKNKVRQIKGDVLIDEIDEIHRQYISYMAGAENDDRQKWPLVPFIVNELIVPKVQAEMAVNSVSGVYAAPTPGTPGASIASTNGLLTEIAADITATDLVPIVTGALTPANIIDGIEGFVDDIPSEWKSKIKRIILAEDLVTMYQRAYRVEFGTTLTYSGMTKMPKVDGTNIELVGIPEMNGSQRMIATYDKNLIVMMNKIDRPTRLNAQTMYRDVVLMLDFFRGYGYRTFDGMFVNDQA